MATANYVQRGEALNYKNTGASDIDAGTLVAFGEGVGVIGGKIPAGGVGVLHVCGVYTADKQAATDVYAFGDPVYYKAADGKLYKTAASGMVLAGWATEASANGATTVTFLLAQGGAGYGLVAS